MISQLPSGVFMVRPHGFGVNPETVLTNKFQETDVSNRKEIARAALEEFDKVSDLLEKYNIPTYILEEERGTGIPDAVFPNNWISFHPDGTVVIYPMESSIRRMERRYDLIEKLERIGFEISRVIDLSCYESSQLYLESTGSMVFDYPNNRAFTCRSSRSSEKVISHLSKLLDLEVLLFDAFDRDGFPIYHTNVMMCIGDNFAVICLDAVREGDEKKRLIEWLENSGHELITISLEQVYAFAGNMLQVTDRSGGSLILMSDSARDVLKEKQLKKISQYSEILSSPIPVIQKYGGGGIRCMMAGIMLPPSAGN